MANFQQIQADAIRVVDRVMAEDLLLFPLTGGRVDATRRGGPVRGVLRVGRNTDKNAAGEPGAAWAQRIAMGKAELHVDRAGALDIHKGDKLRAIERPGAPWFEVLSMTENAHGRLVIDLGAA